MRGESETEKETILDQQTVFIHNKLNINAILLVANFISDQREPRMPRPRIEVAKA